MRFLHDGILSASDFVMCYTDRYYCADCHTFDDARNILKHFDISLDKCYNMQTELNCLTDENCVIVRFAQPDHRLYVYKVIPICETHLDHFTKNIGKLQNTWPDGYPI